MMIRAAAKTSRNLLTTGTTLAKQLHHGDQMRVLTLPLSSHSALITTCNSAQYSTDIVFGSSEIEGDTSKMKTFKELPGPRIYPLFGNVPTLYKEGGSLKFHHASMKLRKKYGDVYRLNLMGFRMVCVSDPDLVEEIFRKEGKYPMREPPIPAWMDYHKQRDLSIGIFVLTGEEWWLHRSALNPKLMKPKAVELYAPSFNQVADDAIRKIISTTDDKGFTKDIEKYLARWSLEGVGTVLFEKRLGALDENPNPESIQYVNSVERLFSSLIEAVYEIPVLSRVFGSKLRRKMFKDLDILYSTGEKYVHEKLQQFKANEQDKSLKENAHGQFIPFLYHTKKMDVKDIVSDINSLLFASVETTSTGTLWALYFLSQNQDKQDRLREEVQNVLHEDSPVTHRDLQSMPYLRAVIKEMLRCASVVPFNARYFNEEVIINGHRVPPNTFFATLHNVMSMDPKYFEEPESFKPERWLRTEGRKINEELHPFINLPFGFGPRMCLGRRLAEMEMQIILAKIIRKYKCDCEQKNVNSVLRGLVKPEVPLRFLFTPV